MKSPMLFWRIFGLLAVLYLLLAAGFVTVVANREKQSVTNEMVARLRDVAIVLSHRLPNHVDDGQDPGLIDDIRQISRETSSRITLVDPSGQVLLDTSVDVSEMSNQSSRPEVIGALREGVGVSRRNSDTLSDELLYVCLARGATGQLSLAADASEQAGEEAFETQLLVRVSYSAAEIDRRVRSVQRFLWLFAISLAMIAGLATQIIARRTIQPLQQLSEFARSVEVGSYDTVISIDPRDREFHALSLAFEQMRRELRRREKALRDNTGRLETVLGSMSEGVVALDSNNRIKFCNRAARNLLSINSSAIEGKTLIEVTRIPIIGDTVEQARQLQQPTRAELETLGVNRRTLMMRITPVQGEFQDGLVVVFHDVTEIRQLETMRRDFVANVSHELKTPLSSIKAYAETLKLGAINDSSRNIEFVDQIELQADRLHQLIRDLIHLARVEAGQTVFDISLVNVAEIVDICVDQFVRLAASREITLETSGDRDLSVLVDFEGLQTILDNLISNAIRYTQPKGSVHVHFEREGDWGKIEVSDTGLGIAPEHQQRIFERFYRVDKARSSDLGGTGLGLAIVKHLTNSFNGELDLVSKVGRGSTFTIRLPLN